MSFRHLINSWLACLIWRVSMLILFTCWSVQAQLRFDSWTNGDGLPQNSVWTILQTGDGYLWTGTYEGLARFDGVDFKVFDNTNTAEMKSNWIRSLAEDHSGNLWIAIEGGGLLRRTNDQFAYYSESDGLPSLVVRKLLADRAGNLWIGTVDGGLAVWRNGQLTVFKTEDGLVDNHVNALYEARDGSLWIGTGNGVSHYENGRFTNYTTADGLSNDRILSFYEAFDGGIWIGTNDGGLSRYKNGILTSDSSRNGLYDNLAFQILESNGDLWMSGNKGIYRASLQELNDVADGKISKLTSYSYGTDDGMLTRECNGASPAGWKTARRFSLVSDRQRFGQS